MRWTPANEGANAFGRRSGGLCHCRGGPEDVAAGPGRRPEGPTSPGLLPFGWKGVFSFESRLRKRSRQTFGKRARRRLYRLWTCGASLLRVPFAGQGLWKVTWKRLWQERP